MLESDSQAQDFAREAQARSHDKNLRFVIARGRNLPASIEIKRANDANATIIPFHPLQGEG